VQITARPDVTVIGPDTRNQLTVLVEITAPPAAATDTPRQPSTLEVVLDRSGSMSGDRLDGAKTALLTLVDRLAPTDNFGLVAFDTTVEMILAAGPLREKAAVKRAIARLDARASTDLSGGYLRGLQEARRVAGPAGATVLLISDGHANAGVTDPVRLGQIATAERASGITTSTLGFGLGYDEAIMSAIARGGMGNEHFAENADTAGELIAGEVDGLLAQTAQAASLLVRMSPHVQAVQVVNDLPVTITDDDGVLAELGSFYADETRKVVLVFDLPALPMHGAIEVATLEFTYVELPRIVGHRVVVSIEVRVVPVGEAAASPPDAVVRTELAYLRAQEAKRRFSTRLTDGDVDAAVHELRDAQQTIAAAMVGAPASMMLDLTGEAETLETLMGETRRGEVAHAVRASSADASRKSRTRGRQS